MTTNDKKKQHPKITPCPQGKKMNYKTLKNKVLCQKTKH